MPNLHITPVTSLSIRKAKDRPLARMCSCSVNCSTGVDTDCVTVLLFVSLKVTPGKFLVFTTIFTRGVSFVLSLKVTSGMTRRINENFSPSPMSIWLDSMFADIAEGGLVLPSSCPNSC